MKKQDSYRIRQLHYNKWKKLSKDDRRKIYEALNNLYGKDDTNNATNDR